LDPRIGGVAELQRVSVVVVDGPGARPAAARPARDVFRPVLGLRVIDGPHLDETSARSGEAVGSVVVDRPGRRDAGDEGQPGKLPSHPQKTVSSVGVVNNRETGRDAGRPRRKLYWN